MTEILEKLWQEYFFEECTRIESEEEKAILRKTAELRKKVDVLLDKEEAAAMQNLLDCIYEGEERIFKKAFLKGALLANSLLLEIYKRS